MLGGPSPQDRDPLAVAKWAREQLAKTTVNWVRREDPGAQVREALQRRISELAPGVAPFELSYIGGGEYGNIPSGLIYLGEAFGWHLRTALNQYQHLRLIIFQPAGNEERGVVLAATFANEPAMNDRIPWQRIVEFERRVKCELTPAVTFLDGAVSEGIRILTQKIVGA